MSQVTQIPDLDSATPGREPGFIRFIRYEALPGVEVMDVQGVSRKWSYFHETYTLCVARWVEDTRDVRWRYRRGTHLMGANGVQLMEPGELHSNLDVAPPANFSVLLLNPARMQEVCRQLGTADRLPHLSVSQLYEGPVRSVMRELTTALVETGDVERAELGVYRLVETLWRTHCFERGPALSRRERGRRAILTARDMIHAAWNEHLPMSALVDETKLPLATLERAFRETFGTSPRQYQLRMRLMRGKELLLGQQGLVGEVAHRCGFQDAKYFSRIFKREFGCQPSDYRRATRRAPA